MRDLNLLRPCVQASRFPLKRVKGTRLYKRNVSGRVTLLPGTELRPVSFNKRRQNEEAFSRIIHGARMFPQCSQFPTRVTLFPVSVFAFTDANYACATLRWSREIIVFWVIGDLHVNQGFISDESHAFAPFQAKIILKFHVTLRSLIGLFNGFIKSDKIQNVAGGNFTRLRRSRIPASYAG